MRSDADVIGESLGRPGAFGEIFERHFDPVFRFAARRVGRDQASDVAAEVFATAFRIRDRFDLSRSSALPWLYGIGQNIIGDRIRKERSRQRVHLAYRHDIGPSMEEAESRLIAAAASHSLNRALRRLRSVDRQVLLLYALEGLTYAEISEVLGIRPGTVGSRLSRARDKIAKVAPELSKLADVARTDDDRG